MTVVCDTYSMTKNASQVFKVSENMFIFHQGDESLEEYYSPFKDMIDELNQYHLITNDIEILKQQLEELCLQVSFEHISHLKLLRDQFLVGEGEIISPEYSLLSVSGFRMLLHLLIPLMWRVMPWSLQLEEVLLLKAEICLLVAVIYHLEAVISPMAKVILETAPSATRPIIVLTNVGNSMEGLHGHLKLHICLIVLDPFPLFSPCLHTRSCFFYTCLCIWFHDLNLKLSMTPLIQKMHSISASDIAILAHLTISCLASSSHSSWIIDSGVSTYMTCKSTHHLLHYLLFSLMAVLKALMTLELFFNIILCSLYFSR